MESFIVIDFNCRLDDFVIFFKGRFFFVDKFRFNCYEYIFFIMILIFFKYRIGRWEDRVCWYFIVKFGFIVKDDIRFMKIKENLKFREMRWIFKVVVVNDYFF